LHFKNIALSNNLMLHHKLLGKQEQIQTQTSRHRKIINIRAEFKEINTIKTIQRLNETKSWFFEKINKINTALPNMTK
jgi:hypothetical protein